jgi:peroxiredoxin
MSLPTVARTRNELAEREALLGDMLSPDQLRVMRDTIRTLVAQGAGSEALKSGAEAPDFILPTADGAPLRLYDQLKSGPVVLVFFRGGWCPFCETYLRGLQRELLYFKELGAQLIAVSPQLPDGALQTGVDHALDFPLVTDAGLRTTDQYGLVYKVPPALLRVYHKIGIQLDVLNGEAGADQLPLAATYIINSDRTIAHVEINEDYTRRYDPVEILATLVRLGAG